MVENVVIGKSCKIGAGAVVVNDMPENATVVGVPAKSVKINVKANKNVNSWPLEVENEITIKNEFNI